MPDNQSLERVQRAPLKIPTDVPVSSYPTEVASRGASVTLLEYWRVLRKRRWTILSVLLLVILTVVIGTLKEERRYEATTVIQIDRESPNIMSFQNFDPEINPYDDSYLETAYKVLQSRSLAYRVIQKLHLENSPEFASSTDVPSWQFWKKTPAAPVELSPEEQFNPKYTALINQFLDDLSISPVRRSQLVEIGFESGDGTSSARIANTLASTYIDMNLEARWESTQKASEWLSQQLVGLKAKLEKSEEDLQSYAKENSILFVDEKQNMNSQKLEQLQEEGTRAQADLISKESIYNQVSSGELSALPGLLDNKLYQDLSLRLADLKREYSELTATFTPEYPKVQRLKSQIDEVSASLDRERSAFAQRVTDDYKAAVNRKRLLDQAIAEQTREFNQVADKSIQYNILKREAETNKQLYDGLLQRMKEASVSAGLRASNVRVVDQAEVPLRPSKPRVVLNFALALLFGMGLGIGMAFFQEYLDNTLKSPDDVQRYLQLPTLGVIPSANAASRKRFAYGRAPSPARSLGEGLGRQNAVTTALRLVGSEDNFAVSEAYRSLRTSVLLSTSGRPPRVILITSGQPGEGKTTTAVNLAIALVQLGGRVLVVDSDMRRPRVGALLQLQNTSKGLSTYLTGQYPLDEVITATSVPDLYAVPCGPIPPNPAELLSSELMRGLMEKAPEKFEYVILDSPPVLHVSDSRILAAQAEAVILVSHGGVTPREATLHAKEELRHVNANLIGIALNNLDSSAAGYDSYYQYDGGYGNPGDAHEPEVTASS